jgi:hypothetical protein
MRTAVAIIVTCYLEKAVLPIILEGLKELIQSLPSL